MKIYGFLISLIFLASCNPEKKLLRYASFLSGKWQLEKINGKSVEKTDSIVPYIEFKPGERFLVGYSGCNKISGIFTVDGPKLVMNDISSTRMACPQLAMETELLQIISLKSLSYKADENELSIYGFGSKIEFKRMK